MGRLSTYIRYAGGRFGVLAIAATPVFAGAGTAQANEVYVANSSSSSVSVIDSETETVVDTVAVAATPLQVAIAPDASRTYVSHSNDTVSVIDTETREVVDSVAAPAASEGIAVEPNGERVFAANSSGNEVAVIDTDTNAVIDRLSSPSPRALALTPDGRKLYVTSQGDDTVSVFDTTSGDPIGSPIAVGTQPLSIAASPDGERMYVANAISFVFGGPDISVIDTETDTVVDDYVYDGPFAVQSSPDSSRLYAVSTSFAAFDTSTGDPAGEVAVGNGLVGLGVHPDGETAYVARNSNNTIAVIDLAGPTVANAIPVGAIPAGVAVVPDLAPEAAFDVAAAEPGEATRFNARRSSDPDGEIVRYDWDFGDGTTLPDGGPRPTHVYEDWGGYEVTLTVTDADGCSTEFVYGGQTAFCSGGPGAAATQTISVPAPQPPAPPSCSGASVSVAHDTPTAIALDCAGEIDGLSVSEPPLHGQLSALDEGVRTIVYTPGPGFSGTDRFRFAATGPGGASEAATVALTVQPAPPLPPPDRARPELSLRVEPRSKRLAPGKRVRLALTARNVGTVATPATLCARAPRKVKLKPRGCVELSQLAAGGTLGREVVARLRQRAKSRRGYEIEFVLTAPQAIDAVVMVELRAKGKRRR